MREIKIISHKAIKEMEDTNLHYKISPRKVWKALLFSLLSLGVGQIYNGQIKKLCILLACILFVPMIFAITKLSTTFYGNVVLSVIFIGLILYMIIDACVSAKLQNKYIPRKYNKWYFHFLFGIIILFGFWLFFQSPLSVKNNYVRYFKIPSMSSEPTVQMGDYIVADMRAYKNSIPDYGDIVIFNMDNSPYLFRVVGKPNDTLSIKDKSLIINNKPVTTLFIETKEIDGFQVNKYEEQLPNGHKHLIYKYIRSPYIKTNIDDVIIPSDSYFLMEDNRDNAMDSRYLGSIKKEQIIGKATYVLYGKSSDKIFGRVNIDLTTK